MEQELHSHCSERASGLLTSLCFIIAALKRRYIDQGLSDLVKEKQS